MRKSLAIAALLVAGCGSASPEPGLASGTCQTLVTAESDGQTWAEYRDGSQSQPTGAVRMPFDPVNRIIYSANGGAGLFALKVIDP